MSMTQPATRTMCWTLSNEIGKILLQNLQNCWLTLAISTKRKHCVTVQSIIEWGQLAETSTDASSNMNLIELLSLKSNKSQSKVWLSPTFVNFRKLCVVCVNSVNELSDFYSRHCTLKYPHKSSPNLQNFRKELHDKLDTWKTLWSLIVSSGYR